MRLLSSRAASLPAGIQVGFGSPSPCLEVNRKPNRLRLPDTVSELSTLCITSRMMLRSLQPRRSIICKALDRCRTSSRIHVFHRGSPSISSVMTVCRKPIMLEPLP